MGLGRKNRGASLTQTRLVGIRVNTSIYGRPIPIVYGAQRLPANLIWYGDFISQTQQQQAGGKGGLVGGGGKGSSKSYVYYAALAAALCEGPIIGLGHVWDGQGALTLTYTSEPFTIPGGGGSHTVMPGGGGVFYRDHGVGRGDAYSVGPFTDFGSPGPVTLAGTQQTPMTVTGGAPGAGQYQVNTSTGQYTFSAADGGKVATISYSYSVPNSAGNGAPTTTLSLTLFTGQRPQTAWSYLTSKHPSQALGYTGLAYIANPSLFLGSSGQLPNLSYEIHGFKEFGAGIVDCNPKDIIVDLLTSAVYGAGFSNAFIGDLSNYSNYCVANGLFLSALIDQQESAAAIIQRILDITNSEAVWSGNVLKIVPYGDITAVGNGATFTPNTTPVYDLNDDDFIAKAGEEPVQIKIGSAIDAYNFVQVEYLNRANAYNSDIVSAQDDGATNIYGLRPQDPVSWHEITSQTVAALVADLLLRKNVYVRNTYSFVVGWRYAVLEPMDMVTITDAGLGLNKAPARIISMEEDESGNLKFECEEFPWGTATPTLYPKEPNAGSSPNAAADPGSVNTPIIAEVNNRVTQQQGYQLWFGVSGQSVANWGGCTVWMSVDGTTYKQIGKIYGPARMGVLTANLGNNPDPDTTHTLSVDLTQSGGALLTGTAADADGDRTLCLVDNELISYQTATLTSPFHYDLTTRLRRGQLGTVGASHSIGAPFLRVDDAVFKYTFDPLLIGSTLHFKFTSFNTAQSMEQPLSVATDYTITIAGNFTGAVDLSTGLVGLQFPASAIIVENANFEASGVILPPPGWIPWGPGITISYDTTTQYSGARSVVCVTGSSDGGLNSLRRWAARAGDVFRISGRAKQTSLGGTAFLTLIFADAAGSTLGSAGASTTSSSWTFISGSAIAPAGTVQAYIELGTTNAVESAEFDEIHVARMQTAFEVTPINTAGTPTTTTGLCTQHSSVSTQIDVAASSFQFGDGTVSYNSGSVNPGSFGTWYIYADDPGFAGGAVTYVATATPSNVNAANGRVFFGVITTVNGTVAVSTGGGSGGGGPRGKANLF